MASLTEQVSALTKRVTALENNDLSESESIPLIEKIYGTVYCTPVLCSDSLACDTTVDCGDDPLGTVAGLSKVLTHIGIGTGSAPSPGDTLLENEVTRKEIIDPVVIDTTLIVTAYWDESEGNGTTFTNAGAFSFGTDIINTGMLVLGGAINQTKEQTKTLTIGVEITAVEV